MTIAYVAQTRDHLLMLDEEGICLHVHRRSKERGDDAADGAICCIGAQFVAALDPSQAGLLAREPTLGVPMIFAKVGASGKISLVRTGPLERFETKGSGFHEVPTRPIMEPPSSVPKSNVRLREVTNPAIRYLDDADAIEDDEPTVRFPSGTSTRLRATARPA